MKRLLCLVGLHRTTVQFGRTPTSTLRTCKACGARWHGTYDGIECGWARIR